ncbi:hypothetical protein [Dysgonomonas massiliensis]|uniref:hypothetical protein n=1 Tax=Dysgonomonas massiliensis TaxID=2040292 RepID=UPI000C77D1FF|nr:hypothetical protein [Dysgonomonas massiliensis]
MKKIITVLCTIALLLSCQSVVAQPKPVISTKYSNEKIQEMISSFKNGYSQDATAPASLVSKFNLDFPNAKDIDWEAVADIYEVEFEIGRVDYKAFYKGTDLLMYTRDIQVSELPAVVKNTAISKYPDYDFEDIEEINIGTDLIYKVELEHHKKEVTMKIKYDGTILKEKFDR